MKKEKREQTRAKTMELTSDEDHSVWLLRVNAYFLAHYLSYHCTMLGNIQLGREVGSKAELVWSHGTTAKRLGLRTNSTPQVPWSLGNSSEGWAARFLYYRQKIITASSNST